MLNRFVKQLNNKQSRQYWSSHLLRVSFFSLYAAFTLEIGSSTAAPVVRLEDWRFYPETLQLEITLSAPSQPRYFYLSQPPRIVVDLPATKLGYISTQQNYSGAIKSIRVSQFDADVTRIVMDLAPGTFLAPDQVQLQPISWQNPTRWVLRPVTNRNNTFLTPRNFSPPGNQPAAAGYYNPPPPSSNQPPATGYYNPPLPPGNLPPATGYHNPPSPPGNLPPATGYHNPPSPPDNQPPATGYYNPPSPPGNQPPATGYYNPPLPPGNQPPATGYHNPPSSPGNLPPATGYHNPPLPPGNLPPASDNSLQPPLVTVPPLVPNSPSQQPNSVLPPPTFPNQPTNLNGVPLFPTPNSPNFPIPSTPNN